VCRAPTDNTLGNSSYYISNPPATDPAPSLTAWSGRLRIFARGTADTAVSGTRFKLPFFFTSTPAAYEALSMIVADEAFSIPPAFAGDQFVKVGTAPAAEFVITLTQNGTAIGTITIGTDETVTLATTDGGPVAVAAGDLLVFTAQGTADTAIANVAAMLWGYVL
jgi:hypothetical protein